MALGAVAFEAGPRPPPDGQKAHARTPPIPATATTPAAHTPARRRSAMMFPLR